MIWQVRGQRATERHLRSERFLFLRSVLFRIVEDQMPPLPDEASENLKEFLTSCFNKDPAARPTAEQLFESEWVKWGLGLHEVSISGSNNSTASSHSCRVSDLTLFG